MSKIREILNRCLSYQDEREWFDLKDNRFDIEETGQYISALSNAAAMAGEAFGYLIWGVDDKTHELTDTKINYNRDINHAFVHNHWLGGDAPMFTAYEDRIEIVSLGTIPPGQTMDGFFSGVSIPVNKKLSEIFLQLHISEKSGRGVPRIVKEYGESAFEFKDNAIVVSIPFTRLNLGGTTPSVTPSVTPSDTPSVTPSVISPDAYRSVNETGRRILNFAQNREQAEKY